MENIDEINKLKEELEIREKFIEQLKKYNEQLKARIKPFEDSYFNGLSPIEIAELAKKSIRLTCENRKLKDALEKIINIWVGEINKIISDCEGENEQFRNART